MKRRQADRGDFGRPDRAAIDAALARGRAALAGFGSHESAELIRVDRRGRDSRDRRR
jgi:hypothetical protein